MNEEPKVLAIFDFDGTITSRDTLLEFTRYVHGTFRFYLGILILSPILLSFKLKIIPNWKAKEIFLKYFFYSMQLDHFNQKAVEFCNLILPDIIRPGALEKIRNYQRNKNVDILIATASAINWVKPWSDKMNIKCIGTELEVIKGHITGNIYGKNCYGKSKFLAVISKYDFSNYHEIHFYGDSRADKIFENKVDQFYYRYF